MAEKAAAGAALPPVKVLTGSTVHIGYLGSVAQVDDELRQELAEQLFNEQRPRRRQEAERVYEVAGREAVAIMDLYKGFDESDQLTLFACRMLSTSGGDGLEIPVVHIPFLAIDAWWILPGKPLPAPDGGGLFAGIMVPMSFGN